MTGPKFDWTVNVSTMISIIALSGACVLGWFNLREQVNINTTEIIRVDAVQKDLVAKRDARIAEVDRRLAEVSQISYRLGNVEGQVQSFQARLDASFSRFGERIDRSTETTAAGFNTVSAELGALKTQMAVLTQRVDNIAPQRRAQTEQ